MQDTTNQKVMTLAFVAAGFLAALVVQVLFEQLAVQFGPVARLHNNETLRHALPVGVGLLTFGFMQFNAKIKAWAEECITEVRKVVWPSRRDTMAMTIVVCVMVVIVGVALGIFDLGAQKVLKMFVNLTIFH